MTGLPIVWVPGHLCGPWLYARQLGVFGERHPTVIADTTQDDSIAAMAARLLAGAPERFVIAGLSMGGMVAMEAMTAAPDRIAGAVLMDTDPTAARAKERAWRAGLVAKVRRRGLGVYVDAFAPRFFGHSSAAEAELLPFVRTMMSEVPVEVFERQARALDTRCEMAGRLSGYDGPVEIVVGAEDRICPPALHTPLAEILQGAVLTELPDTGHLATLEAAEAVNERISALLARVKKAG